MNKKNDNMGDLIVVLLVVLLIVAMILTIKCSTRKSKHGYGKGKLVTPRESSWIYFEHFMH